MARWKSKDPKAAGSLPLAVALTYPIEKKTGCQKNASAKKPLVSLNRSVYQWDLVLQNSEEVLLHLKYADRKEGGLYNEAPEMFLTEPVAVSNYDKVVDAFEADELKAFITLKGWYYQVLREFLTMLPSTSSRLTNFACPEGPHKDGKVKPGEWTVMSLFDPKGKLWKLSKQQFLIESICTVLGSEAMFVPGGKGLVPAGSPPPNGIKLAVQLHLNELPKWDGAVERLVACDWSGLFDHSPPERGKKPPAGFGTRLDRWQNNVATYFNNYTNLDRGKKIFDELVSLGEKAFESGNRSEAVQTVRDGIDQRVVTANSFAGTQETSKVEPYQGKVQRLLGSIKRNSVEAAPVYIFRKAAAGWGYSEMDQVQFVLQSGVGHCGEHALVSFEVLKEINKKLKEGSKPGPLEPIVLASEANVDHAFVVVGIQFEFRIPVELLPSSRYVKENPGIERAQNLWDLEEAVRNSAALGRGEGDICDPYLEKEFPTARSMLEAILRKRSKFLLVHDFEQSELQPSLHPAPPGNAELKHLNFKLR